MHAKGGGGAVRALAGSDSCRVRVSREEGDARQAGPACRRQRGGALIWAGRGRWAGGRGSLGRFGLRERREGKKKRLGLGQKEKGKGDGFCIF